MPTAKSNRRGRPRTRASAKRSKVSPRGDARFVRRESGGQFRESDDAGRSLRTDRKTKARRKVKSGYGDRGDQRRRSGAR